MTVHKIPLNAASRKIDAREGSFIVLQNLSLSAFSSPSKFRGRTWAVVETPEEAQERLNIWPDAKVFRVGEPVPMEPTVRHYTMCDYVSGDGDEKPCNCEELHEIGRWKLPCPDKDCFMCERAKTHWTAFGASMGLMLRAHEVTRSSLKAALKLIRQEKRRRGA